MKKLIVVTLACLAVCGVWAQNAGTLGASDVKEYVSVVLTMGAKEVPQDSLARYGVLVQTRNGRIATALVPVDNYEAFLHSGLVQVQPSTRVFLRDSQVSSQPATKHCENHTAGVRPDEGRDEPHAAADMRSDDPRRGHDVHRGHPYDHHGAADRPARRNMIPADRIADEDARGCFFGLLLGGSRNWELVDNAAQAGYWYVDQGLNLDVRTGYQFNQNVGFITGLQLLSKNYSTDVDIDNIYYETRHSNLYLQLPLLADFSLGNEAMRIHLALGGYAGLWCSQLRNGYVYSPSGNTGIGWKRGFEEGYDQRFDAGLTGGVGLSFQLTPYWQLRFEGNYYYSLISNKQDPYKQYNRTTAFGMGLTYHF